MTNNTQQVSAPRELLEKAMLACFEAGHGITHDLLRSLLEVSAASSTRIGAAQYWSENEQALRDAYRFEGLKGLVYQVVCDCAKPAAPAEDVRAVGEEPVAWRWEWKTAREHDGWCYVHKYPDAKVAHLMDIEPLYRHPQRPVVLPERKQAFFGSDPWEFKGWNACIDEFERLNK